jgi:hypothetical protein
MRLSQKLCVARNHPLGVAELPRGLVVHCLDLKHVKRRASNLWTRRDILGRSSFEITDHRHRRLLRPRHHDAPRDLATACPGCPGATPSGRSMRRRSSWLRCLRSRRSTDPDEGEVRRRRTGPRRSDLGHCPDVTGASADLVPGNSNK